MGTLLTKQQILEARDLPTEDVHVPEWGGTVRVRALGGLERDRYESSLVIGTGAAAKFSPLNIRAKLVAAAVVDDRGKRLFSEEDVAALGEKSGAALDRVFEVAQRLSGLSQKDMEDLRGNSGRGQSGESTSS